MKRSNTHNAGSGRLHELVRHLDAGDQITTGVQWIYKASDNLYFACCDTPGCCDDYMTAEELRVRISDAPEWKIVPNEQDQVPRESLEE